MPTQKKRKSGGYISHPSQNKKMNTNKSKEVKTEKRIKTEKKIKTEKRIKTEKKMKSNELLSSIEPKYKSNLATFLLSTQINKNG